MNLTQGDWSNRVTWCNLKTRVNTKTELWEKLATRGQMLSNSFRWGRDIWLVNQPTARGRSICFGRLYHPFLCTINVIWTKQTEGLLHSLQLKCNNLQWPECISCFWLVPFQKWFHFHISTYCISEMYHWIFAGNTEIKWVKGLKAYKPWGKLCVLKGKFHQ